METKKLNDLGKRAKEVIEVPDYTLDSVALAIAAFKAGTLGARYVLLSTEDGYVELYDLVDGDMMWWNSEEDFFNEFGEKLEKANVLVAVKDGFRPVALVLQF